MEACTHQFDMRKYSRSENLLSRQQGQRVLEGIKKELNELPLGGVLLLDFRNIRHATSTCLIEVLSVVSECGAREFQGRHCVLKLESANCDLRHNLIFALKEQNSVVLSLDEKDNWEILGELTKAQRDTFEIAKERGEVTSTEISRFFNIPINAASNRLRDLYNMKLITREEKILSSTGGREFVYRCVLR